MMRRLFENTVISAGAFVVVSGLGILIVPIIVRTWGLAEFGLIALVRSVLPVGVLAIFDLGVSEITTQTVARARVGANWDDAARRVACTFLIALTVGVLIAAVLVATAPLLVSFFRVPQEHAAGFQLTLYATAAANVVVFPALVAEGILKGFERFPTLRMLDVASAAAYLGTTAAAAYTGQPFETVALCLMANVTVRAVIVAFLALATARREGVPLRLVFDPAMLADTLRWAWAMAVSKMIGGAQGPLLPVIVGALFGPRAVGIYDILVRLPRFSKSALSILNASVLPVSAKMDEQGADSQMRRLAVAGLVILPALTVPPLVWAAVSSEAILRLWVGPSMTDHWPWMALAFAVPIVSQYLSFGQVVMLGRQSALALLNRIALLQTVLMAVVALATFQMLEERSFVLAQAVSFLAILPVQLWVISREFGVRRLIVARVVAVQTALMLPPGAAMLMLADTVRVDNLWELVISLALWCGVLWPLEYLLLLNRNSQGEVRQMALAAFGMIAHQKMRR